jgi:hypothetical protein
MSTSKKAMPSPEWFAERRWAFWCVKNLPLNDGTPWSVKWANWAGLPELVDEMESHWLANTLHDVSLVEEAFDRINENVSPKSQTTALLLLSAFGVDIYYMTPRQFSRRLALSASYHGFGPEISSEERIKEFERFDDMIWEKAKEMGVVT